MNYIPPNFINSSVRISMVPLSGRPRPTNNIQDAFNRDHSGVFNFNRQIGSTGSMDYMLTGLPSDMPKLPERNHLDALTGYPKNWPDFMRLMNDGTMTKDEDQTITLIDGGPIESKAYTMSEEERTSKRAEQLLVPRPIAITTTTNAAATSTLTNSKTTTATSSNGYSDQVKLRQQALLENQQHIQQQIKQLASQQSNVMQYQQAASEETQRQARQQKSQQPSQKPQQKNSTESFMFPDPQSPTTELRQFVNQDTDPQSAPQTSQTQPKPIASSLQSQKLLKYDPKKQITDDTFKKKLLDNAFLTDGESLLMTNFELMDASILDKPQATNFDRDYARKLLYDAIKQVFEKYWHMAIDYEKEAYYIPLQIINQETFLLFYVEHIIEKQLEETIFTTVDAAVKALTSLIMTIKKM